MADVEFPLGLSTFACGGVKYFDTYADSPDPRLVLPIRLGTWPSLISAVVDTGAPWCVFDPVLVGNLGSDIEHLQPIRKLNIRGIAYSGWLYRLPVRLEAMLGQWLEVEATAFIPELSAGQVWPFPNFIGLEGFLSRIRFAMDPSTNFFFFGPLDSD